jgi:5'-methylthioadenosine phosphorylase
MSDITARIGVIGGSGLYTMPQITEVEDVDMVTPFGRPSDTIVVGTLNGTRVAFLARHGRGHIYLPHEVPYRANIFALKLLGVERIVSISACGSLREDFAPGHIVIPDQLYDNTKGKRDHTFFGDGLVTHVGVAEPFCNDLRSMVAESVRQSGGIVHSEGAFITIEGPRFSTRAESNVYRSWGMSIVGMTTSPEAYLAREAEICYAVMAHVTDYDVWHEGEEPVTVDMVVRILNQNLEIAQQAIARLVTDLARRERRCACPTTLAQAMLTDRRKIPPETLERLKPLTGKYLGPSQ